MEASSQAVAGRLGWRQGDPASEDLLLRAQLALAALLGILAMRVATPVEPLASTAAERLDAWLGRMLRTMLRET